MGWVLGSLAELIKQKREPVPPVGIIPLGTGNDLSRSFGWVRSCLHCHFSLIIVVHNNTICLYINYLPRVVHFLLHGDQL